MNAVLRFAGLCALGPAILAPQQPARPYAPQTWEKPIAPGLVYREELDYQAHRTVHALRFSLRSPAVRASAELFGHTTFEEGAVTGRGSVSGMVAADHAIAGINGDFFSMAEGPSGDPLGLTVRDGRILSTPSKRVAFGWGPQDAASGTATLTARVGTADGGWLRIDGLNRKCPQNELTLDTEDAGLALSDAPCIAVVLKFDNPIWAPSTMLRGTVESVSADVAKQHVESKRAILVARGTKADKLAGLSPGSQVTLDIQTTGFDWEKIDNVVGGGPRLVQNGAVAIDGKQEGFAASFVDKKHPRTAIGRTKVGDLWFVAVDGRQETGDGMTLDELAQLMLRLGCVDAINLDGGGSTTMNVLGVTVNRPSDGQERSVADGVVFLGPKPRPSEERLNLAVPKRLHVGQDLQARVIDGNGKSIPNREVIWGCTGASAIDQNGSLRPLQPGAASISAFARGRTLTAMVIVGG